MCNPPWGHSLAMLPASRAPYSTAAGHSNTFWIVSRWKSKSGSAGGKTALRFQVGRPPPPSTGRADKGGARAGPPPAPGPAPLAPQHGPGFAGGAPRGHPLDGAAHAHAAHAKVREVPSQRLPGERGDPGEVFQGQDPGGGQPVFVQELAVVRRVSVGELAVGPQPLGLALPG